MTGQRILLIVGGGIAAYKACELIRRLRGEGYTVRCVLTEGGAHFVTAMTLAALSEQPVHTSLWDLKDEAEMGHIRLSREADLIIVCPATADLMARAAAGIADDLATTLLLATDAPVMMVPAMNVRMWSHAATRRNVVALRRDGVIVLDPDDGAMACGEFGPGRLPEIDRIVSRIGADLAHPRGMRPAERIILPPLRGRRIIVTAGPTHEPIDPVRYIANRSSGKQGFAIAAELGGRGADVMLVAGPVTLPTPFGVRRFDVETAEQMWETVMTLLPADVAIMSAAVADWRIEPSVNKIKKTDGLPKLDLMINRDILFDVSRDKVQRPQIVVGFAAETENLIENARTKLAAKGCDWIVANDVSGDVMGGDHNEVHIVTKSGVDSWGRSTKHDVAVGIAELIEKEFGRT